jgi:hypothetical protein
MAIDTTYLVKWDNTLGAKVWAEGDPEPDWQVTYDTPALAPDVFWFNMDAPLGTPGGTTRTDYIRFLP